MQSDPSRRRSARRGVSWIRLAGAVALWCAGVGAWVALVPQMADAATNLVAVADLNQVITNLRNVLVGLLVGLATLFATIGGVRYILAGGDPGEVEAAKKTLKYAALGYGIAVLAPVLVQILKKIVGA